jgi:hypothetical protein
MPIDARQSRIKPHVDSLGWNALIMTQLTVTIDDSAAEKVQRVAQQRQVTVDCLVQELIQNLDGEQREARRQASEALDESFRLVSTPMGGKPWSDRDELYDR